MINPLQINDLDIKSFLKIILAIQLAMWGVTGLDTIGLQIPILRPIIGVIYLTFVPGIILLRILKVHNIDKTKFVLYSVGLSIAFIMFASALTNSLLYALKIPQPISPLPLTIALSIFITLLCLIAYIQDKEFQPSGIECVNTDNLLAPSYPFLLLLPFIAIFGAFFVNFYKNETILIILIFIIAIIAALIAFNKFIPEKVYPLAIYAIAISIVLHVSLLSPYPYGWNIDNEYYSSELVATSGYWDSSFAYTSINSLLSIVMLAPVYTKMLGINITWVFKAIYPFIHSLLPLAIFAACREQMGAKKAFFSSFFFMSLSGFFSYMSLFRREQIATLFLALLVLVMVDKKLTSIQRSSLAIVFVISLPVSHYGTSYLSIMIFLLGMVFLYLTTNKQTIFNKKISKKTNKNTTENSQKNIKPSILKWGIILVWSVFMLSWFMFIAGGSSFNGYVNILENSFSSLADFFNPETRPDTIYKTFGMKLPPAAVLGWIYRIIHYFTEAFIVVGFIALVFRPKIFKLKEEYRALLIATALFLFVVMFLPAMGKNWNTGRLYNFVLIIIAPLILFGCEAIWDFILCLIKSDGLHSNKKLTPQISNVRLRFHDRDNQTYIKILAIAILIPYLLFNSGFINEIAKNHVDVAGVPRSTPLNLWNNDSMYYNEREVSGAEWLDSTSGDRFFVVGDAFSTDLLTFWSSRGSSYGVSRIALEKNVHKNDYIFFRMWNVEKQEVLVTDPIRETSEYINPEDIPVLCDAINIRNKVYDNGGAQVFAPSG